jgi:hypothetical protein
MDIIIQWRNAYEDEEPMSSFGSRKGSQDSQSQVVAKVKVPDHA